MTTQPYSVKVLLDHPTAKVLRVHLAPGETTPKHSHDGDYIVHPHQTTTLVKTTYKDGAVLGIETVTHTADTAYPVSKSADGTEFTIQNTGSAAMMCDKTLLPPPPKA